MEQVRYKGKFITVTEEVINGHVYERAHCVPGVHVIPVTADGKIIFIKELRVHETPSERWKLVGGVHEDGKTLEDAANQELQEELKLRANTIIPYRNISRKGTFSESTALVIAKDLVHDPRPNPDGEHVILATQELTLDDAYHKALDGYFPGDMAYWIIQLHHDVKKGSVKW